MNLSPPAPSFASAPASSPISIGKLNLLLSCTEETAALASVIAPLLHPGDTLMLHGEMAAGKTHFVKALAAALGSTDVVTSPTFTIANFYSTGVGTLLHIDAYRLSGVAEYRDLGLEGYADTAITVVEWAQIVAEEFPCHLSLAFAFVPNADEARMVRIEACGERWRADVALLSKQLMSEQLTSTLS
jgi:tRNA threonylcarbamoyladenosine biosynthesis protein TsaE